MAGINGVVWAIVDTKKEIAYLEARQKESGLSVSENNRLIRLYAALEQLQPKEDLSHAIR